MTREEANLKPICAKCQWCKMKSIDHATYTENVLYCSNEVTHLDPITGDEEWMECQLANFNFKCQNFKVPKKSKFEMFLDKLFKVKNE